MEENKVVTENIIPTPTTNENTVSQEPLVKEEITNTVESGETKEKNKDLISDSEAVFLGKTYRITVLTERLLRLEYHPNGIFYDNKTEWVSFRNFPKPEFEVNKD